MNVLKVDNDPFFQRDGSDVHVEVPISISSAILGFFFYLYNVIKITIKICIGDTIIIPTLTGEAELKVSKFKWIEIRKWLCFASKVPPGTQPDQQLVMRAKGVKI